MPSPAKTAIFNVFDMDAFSYLYSINLLLVSGACALCSSNEFANFGLLFTAFVIFYASSHVDGIRFEEFHRLFDVFSCQSASHHNRFIERCGLQDSPVEALPGSTKGPLAMRIKQEGKNRIALRILQCRTIFDTKCLDQRFGVLRNRLEKF